MYGREKNNKIWVGLMWLGLSLFPLSGPSHANDSEAELSMGGLVLKKSDHIEMRSEDLFISSKLVRVKYRFVNRSKAPVKTIVAFPIPDVDLNDGDTKGANDDTFKTSVNGTAVKVAVERRAFVGAEDVTETLAKFGVSPNLSDATGLNRISQEAQTELVTKNIAQKGDYWDQSSSKSRAGLVPNWTLRTNYYWEQIFLPGAETMIEHSYEPVVGGAAGDRSKWSEKDLLPNVLPDYRKKFCLEDSIVRSLQSQVRHEIWISYILSTGANWASPIRDFRLVVDKGHPDNLVSFCAEGVKKISPTQFEVRKRNFIPKEDLHIAIFRHD